MKFKIGSAGMGREKQAEQERENEKRNVIDAVQHDIRHNRQCAAWMAAESQLCVRKFFFGE